MTKRGRHASHRHGHHTTSLEPPREMPLANEQARLAHHSTTRLRGTLHSGGAGPPRPDAGSALVAVSLVVVYLDTDTSTTALVARNVEAAAEFLREESRITLVTDRRSARTMAFYRGFRGDDAILDFRTGGNLLHGGALAGGRPVFVLVNGPIVNEKEINEKTVTACVRMPGTSGDRVQHAWRAGREDLAHRERVLDRGDQAHPPPAPGAGQHVEREGRHVILHLLPVMWRDRREPQ